MPFVLKGPIHLIVIDSFDSYLIPGEPLNNHEGGSHLMKDLMTI